MMYIMLLVGFVLLIKGADFFVDGSSSVAKLLKVPSVVIGLTIVALGTSAPELAVSVTAGLQGKNDIALSNVVGSNAFNMLIVIGVCALIKPFMADLVIIKRDLPVNIGASLILVMFLIDGKISRIEGLIFLLALIVYLVFVVKQAIKNRTEADEEIKTKSPVLSVLLIIIGAIMIIKGGDITVDSACKIAKTFGMSDTLIGLTIIAVGTSLPELVTSIVAARKGESGLALGNAVGSCLMNIFCILGLSASLSAIVPEKTAIYDSIIVAAIAIVVYIFSKTSKKTNRAEGACLVAMYISYMVYAILR